jgi:hypothetical protein
MDDMALWSTVGSRRRQASLKIWIEIKRKMVPGPGGRIGRGNAEDRKRATDGERLEMPSSTATPGDAILSLV